MDADAAADLLTAIVWQARADLTVPRYADEARDLLEFLGAPAQPFEGSQAKRDALCRLIKGRSRHLPQHQQRQHHDDQHQQRTDAHAHGQPDRAGL